MSKREWREHEVRLDLYTVIATEADQHLDAMLGLSDAEVAQYVRNVFDTNIMVFGAYPDPSMPAGVEVILIQGREAVFTMRDTGKLPRPFTATALRYESREQTIAACRRWGDGKR